MRPRAPLPTRLRSFLAALPLLLTFAGVAPAQEEPPPPAPEVQEEESDLWNDVRHWYEAAKERGEKVPGDVYEWVRLDLQAAGDWEYLVLEPEPGAAADLQEELNRLGAERWELAWARESGRRTQYILKRPVRSYLRQLSPRDLLRLVPGGGGGGGD